MRINHSIICLLLLISFAKVVTSAVMINEIMTNPKGEEKLNEWIELYNNDDKSTNLNWYIGDNYETDVINGDNILPAYSYAIITANITDVYNNFDVSDSAVRLSVADSLIGNGLSNSGDTIYLYDSNKNLIDKVTYNKTKEGLSISFVDSKWLETNPTPGYKNAYETENNANNIDNANDVKNKCDFDVKLLLNKLIFDNSTDFKFGVKAEKLNGDSAILDGTVTIEENDNVIKSYKIWNNEAITTQKTSNYYSPKLDAGEYKLTANINLNCEDYNLNNDIDSATIIIKEAKKDINETTIITASLVKVESPYTKDNKSEIVENKENDKKINDTEYNNVISAKASKTVVLYESKSEKIKKIIPILIIAISIVLNIILIWKR